MKKSNWLKIESLYEKALILKHAQREAFVKKESKGDTEVYQQVINMLKLDDNNDFMSGIPSEITTDALNKHSDVTQIGHFEIIEKIASGGMGVVYKACSRLSDVKIVVALKTIRSELKNEDLESRFFNEKAILAKLKHKNIASLIDAGITENGTPYIATEWVDGVNLMHFVRNNTLDLKERLKLFQQLCSAVSHAHNQFIIHRDIKPANILIDNDNQVKLLDFGIAKLIEEDDLNSTQTQIFTPNYAAPEQINGQLCTVTTDVYALGVLLFELLTSVKRFKLNNLSLSERIKLICNPTSINASDVIENNEHIIRANKLKGELNTIINKAMHVETNRRYESVALLSEDINRYLNNRPIKAMKDSWFYRTGMFLKRNKWTSFLTGLVIASLVVGIVISSQQARIAKKEALKSSQLQEFFQNSLHAASPVNGGSTTISVRDMFVSGAKQFDLSKIEDKQTRAEIAAEIGLIFSELEEYDLSKKYTQKSIDYYSENLKHNASEYLHYSIQYSGYFMAQENYQQALNQLESAYNKVKSYDIAPSVLAEAFINMGVYNKNLNNIELALKAYNTAEIHAKKVNDLESMGKISYYKYILLKEEEDNEYLDELLRNAQRNFEKSYTSDNHPDLISVKNSLAMRMTDNGDYQQADELFGELSKQVSKNSDNIDYINSINHANVKYYLGDFKQTIALTTMALNRMQELNSQTSFTEMAAKIIQARALTELNQFELAEKLFIQARDYFSKQFDNQHVVMMTLNASRINLYLKSYQLDKALRLSEGMEKFAQEQLNETPSTKNRYVNTMLTLGCLNSQLNGDHKALKYFKNAHSVLHTNTHKQGWIYWVIQAGIEKSHFKLKNQYNEKQFNFAVQQLFMITDENSWYHQFFSMDNGSTKP